MDLRRGSIAWLLIADRRAQNTKRRPLVIVKPTHEIKPGELVAGVAVTTTATDPPPPECVELPWDPLGRAPTGLRKRSCAVCNWLVKVMPGELDVTDKYVPQDTVSEIIRRLPPS